MYEIFEQLLREKGVRAVDVSRATGISSATFTDWKKGRYTPKNDKLQKIADYFGVSVEYLRGDVDHRLDEQTVASDMDAFATYLKSQGWKTTPYADQYIIDNGHISINISKEQYEDLEHDVRNACVDRLLKYVTEYLKNGSVQE